MLSTKEEKMMKTLREDSMRTVVKNQYYELLIEDLLEASSKSDMVTSSFIREKIEKVKEGIKKDLG
jgi:hypothetical protein